ncbi:MAG: acylphosphatase [Acidimicrobiales bacterium]
MLVSGLVQGVFFRATCRRLARAEGLAGWVRNLPDGRVEACFEGPPDAVRRLIEWCGRGPDQARVSGVEVFDEPVSGAVAFD